MFEKAHEHCIRGRALFYQQPHKLDYLWYVSACSCYHLNKCDEAFEYIQQALRIAPQDARYRIYEGISHFYHSFFFCFPLTLFFCSSQVQCT